MICMHRRELLTLTRIILIGLSLALAWVFTAAGHVETSPVNLKVLPAENTVVVGNTFTVTVVAEAGSQLVDGVLIFLDFSSDVLRVTNSPVGTPLLPTSYLNNYDNIAGTIDYAAGATSGNQPSGSFTVLTIQFEALTPIENTSLNFSTTEIRKTDVMYAGISILGGISPGTIKVVEPKKVYFPLLTR